MNDANRIAHPCAKPMKVSRWLISRAAMPGDTVCDPFMGSGSFGVAALRRGCNFIGIEIDPHYFAIAEKRINAELNRHPLFDPPMRASQRRLSFDGDGDATTLAARSRRESHAADRHDAPPVSPAAAE
jgi:ribosomal protein L11 methylase PrmA